MDWFVDEMLSFSLDYMIELFLLCIGYGLGISLLLGFVSWSFWYMIQFFINLIRK